MSNGDDERLYGASACNCETEHIVVIALKDVDHFR